MPVSAPSACVEPGCPRAATDRGRCATHRRTEEQRGYGRDWRQLRSRARKAACERCGSTRDLALDHIVPQSLGGTNEPSNLRTLCARCHGSIGMRSDRKVR